MHHRYQSYRAATGSFVWYGPLYAAVLHEYPLQCWAMQPHYQPRSQGQCQNLPVIFLAELHHDWQASEYASRACQVGWRAEICWMVDHQLMSPWVTLDARHAHLHARCAVELPHRPRERSWIASRQCLARLVHNGCSQVSRTT